MIHVTMLINRNIEVVYLFNVCLYILLGTLIQVILEKCHHIQSDPRLTKITVIVIAITRRWKEVVCQLRRVVVRIKVNVVFWGVLWIK
jgi:hypothetical protein